jgi:hypothetical protein
VRRVQGGGHLGHDVAGTARGKPAMLLEDRQHVAPLDQAHRDEQDPFGLAGFEDGHDVRVVDRGRDAGFPDEPLPERLVAAEGAASTFSATLRPSRSSNAR